MIHSTDTDSFLGLVTDIGYFLEFQGIDIKREFILQSRISKSQVSWHFKKLKSVQKWINNKFDSEEDILEDEIENSQVFHQTSIS